MKIETWRGARWGKAIAYGADKGLTVPVRLCTVLWGIGPFTAGTGFVGASACVLADLECIFADQLVDGLPR